MRTNTSSWAWLWVLLAVLGGLGGAIYYYKANGFAPGKASTDLPADSALSRTDTAVGPVAQPAQALGDSQRQCRSSGHLGPRSIG